MRRFTKLFTLLLITLILLGCGGGAEPEPDRGDQEETPTEVVVKPTEVPEEPTEVPATATPEESGGINSLQDVELATIQIEAQGSFVDPEVGLQLNAAGAGSGFIIDESGIAVTNNHVVTGAALLKVYIGGDTSKPYNARVLGASECSDLALIDIEGDGFPYLEWHEGEIDVGLDIYAAGFPLGDPEFTLTRGIVSKARTSGETDWASVDRVIEHDATINPGNSGGPLVDADGRVVGVNYAGASATNQYFAIARDEALEMIEQLREGDATSIGVNGQAVTDGESLSGIWVASVKSGSPADSAGVKGGDIITMLEGLVLATDGTMSDYCDILRSRNADDTMNIEVLRFATEEYLEGQLNGRELEQSFSFAQELGEEVAEESPSGDTGTEAGYGEYVAISDDSNQLSVEVPAAWSETNGSAWVMDEAEVGVAVSASANLDNYNNTWTEPGFFFGASRSLAATTTPEALIDSIQLTDSCEYGGRESYEDPLYKGSYDTWTNCGDSGSVFIVLGVQPEDASFVAIVQVQIVSEADLEALDRILNSFVVTGTLE